MHSPSLMREKEWLLKNKETKIDRMDKHKKKENTGTISGYFYTGQQQYYSTDNNNIYNQG